MGNLHWNAPGYPIFMCAAAQRNKIANQQSQRFSFAEVKSQGNLQTESDFRSEFIYIYIYIDSLV